jgi:hypothetical protein
MNADCRDDFTDVFLNPNHVTNVDGEWYKVYTLKLVGRI